VAGHLLLEGVDLSGAPANTFVVEIGSVREASPLPSSLYLDIKAKEFSLNFLTIDASPSSAQLTQQYVGDKAILSDGKRFLQEFSGAISVLCLDNFDYPVNESHFRDICRRSGNFYEGETWSSMQKRAADTHFEQFLAALPKLTSPCWVIMDDTGHRRLFKRLFHPFWGKGERVVPHAIQHGFSIAREGLGGIMLSRGIAKPTQVLKWLNLYCGSGRTRIFYNVLGYQAPDFASKSHTGRPRDA
jgi:hypothetical protein